MRPLGLRTPPSSLMALSVTIACTVSVELRVGSGAWALPSWRAVQDAPETPVQASVEVPQIEFTQEEYDAQRLRMDALVESGALTDQQMQVRLDQMQAMLADPASTARMFTLYVKARDQLDEQFESGAISAFSRQVQMEALDSMIFGAPGPKTGNPTQQLEEGVAFGIGLPILYTSLQKQMEPDEESDPEEIDKRIIRRLEALYRKMGSDGKLAPRQLESRLANLRDLPKLKAQLARMRATEELSKARVRLQRMVDRGEITPEQMQDRLDELKKKMAASGATRNGSKPPPSTPPLETAPEQPSD